MVSHPQRLTVWRCPEGHLCETLGCDDPPMCGGTNERTGAGCALTPERLEVVPVAVAEKLADALGVVARDGDPLDPATQNARSALREYRGEN